jgi:hypothetical protein
VGPVPFAAWQAAFDPLLTPGSRNYWKSHNFTGLEDGFLDLVVDYVSRLPGPQCEVFLGHLGGAVRRLPTEATAYPHRDAEFVMNVHTRWDDRAEDGRCMDWARAMFDASAAYATGGVYVNFIPEDEDRVAAAYGANHQRLRELKRRYDPGNLFRVNQNVVPALAA